MKRTKVLLLFLLGGNSYLEIGHFDIKQERPPDPVFTGYP